MSIPGQDLTIRDPGLGLVSLSGNTFCFLGTSEKGTVNVVQAFNSPADVVDTLGNGRLTQALCHVLQVGGGPVYGCRLTGSVAGTNSSVTVTRTSTSTGTITFSGAPLDAYQATISIVATGTLGTGTFEYSLDNGRTWSETMTIPSGGTYLIPSTNVTATFVAGAGATFFEAGDTHTFTTTAPHYGATDLASGLNAITTYLSTVTGFSFDAIFAMGRNATGSGAATLFGTLSTQMASFAQKYQFMRAAMDGGSGDTDANVKTAFGSLADRRIALVYGDAVISSGAPFAGYAAPLMPLLVSAAARAKGTADGETLISTDLARVATGPLTGVLAISHDEYVTETLDAAKISTSRTMPLANGYFLTNMRLKSPAGSDFLYWQHGRIMDVACRTVAAKQMQFLSAGYAVNDDGTLQEYEAKRLESIVNDALMVELMDPKDVEGAPGHVSAFKYTVDRTNNVLSSQTLQSKVAIRPKGYVKDIVTELGYASDVG